MKRIPPTVLVLLFSMGCGSRALETPNQQRSAAPICVDPPCSALPCPSTKIADVGTIWALGATRTRLFAATLDPDGHSYEIDRCSGALRTLPDAGRDRSIATRGDDVCVGGSCDIGGAHHMLGVGAVESVAFDETTLFATSTEAPIMAWKFGSSSPTTLVDTKGRALAHNGKRLFWLSRIGETAADCAVFSMDPNDGTAARWIGKTSCDLGVMMVADDHRVYLKGAMPTVTIMDAVTGTKSIVSATPATNTGNAIAIDDSFVYFSEISDTTGSGAGRVLRVAKDGVTPTVVAANGSQYALAVDDRYVYWATRTELFRTQKTP